MKLIRILFSLFFLLAAIGLFLRSDRGTQLILSRLPSPPFQYDEIQGSLFSRLTFKNLTLPLPGGVVTCEHLDVEISALRLLRRQLLLTYCSGKGLSWTPLAISSPSRESPSTPPAPLPLSLSIPNFEFKRVTTPLVSGDFTGRARLSRKLQRAFFSTQGIGSFGSGKLQLSYRDGALKGRLQLATPAFTGDVIAKGKLRAFLDLISPTGALAPASIRAVVRGAVAYPLPHFPATWQTFASITRERNRDYLIRHFTLGSTGWHVDGTARFAADLSPLLLRALASTTVLPTPFKTGVATFRVQYEEGQGHLEATLPPAEIRSVLLTHNRFTFDGTLEGKNIIGALQASWKLDEMKWDATSRVLWTFPSPLVQFSKLALSSPLGTISGDLLADESLLSGNLEINLDQLHPFVPELYGSLAGTLSFSIPPDRTQSLMANLDSTSLYFQSAHAASLHVTAAIDDLYKNPSGLFSISGTAVRYKGITLDTLCGEANREAGVTTFALSGEGRPLSFALQGYEESGSGTLQALRGTFLEHSFLLNTPAYYTLAPSSYSISGVDLTFGTGTLTGSYSKAPQEEHLSLALQRFPLTPYTELGPVDLTAQFDRSNNSQTGHLIASLPQGSIQADLSDHILDLNAALTEPNLSLTAHYDKVLSGRLFYKGRIESLLDLVNLGTHHLEGDSDIDLSFHGTHLNGYARLSDGSYENYRTGTELTSLEGEVTAEGSKLVLNHLTAWDGTCTGTLSATGSLAIEPADHFPYSLDLTFSHFNALQISWAQSAFDGVLRIRGSTDGATASGDILVTDSHLMIPDKIARPLPNLPLHYLHAPKPLPLPQTPSSTYPVTLHLHLSAPDHIAVTGRGLESEWKGDVKLEGPLDSLQALGTCELTSGKLNFSGRFFKIDEGLLKFTGAPGDVPLLHIAGTLTEKGVSIHALLDGPLTRPQLSFTSTPPLPQTSILSYLLFGEDVSEITAFQAIQLANTLASLSGDTASLLESTRRNLGIDRLRVITAPSGSTEGGQTLAVQVGKYITEGVIITLTQPADTATPSIAVEVDLKKGFVFEAERDETQQQGRFSLLWNRNY